MPFGDVKKSDELFDKLARQLKLNEEAKREYPNVSSLLGENKPEDYYRFKQEPTEFNIFSENKYPEKYKQDINYGPIYKMAQEMVDKKLPDAKQSEVDELSMLNKALDYRHIAEKLAAEAYSKDILKPKDNNDLNQEFLNKFIEKEQMKPVKLVDFTFAKNKFNAHGEYDPKDRSVYLYSPSLGTLMHELGHADTMDKGAKDYRSETSAGDSLLSEYLAREMRKNPELEDKYGPQRYYGRTDSPLKGTIHQAPVSQNYPEDDKEKFELLKKAIKEGHGALIAKKLSQGHHGKEDIIQYPIDKTFQEYEKELEKRGFEKELPEESEKFNKLKSIINTLRNINK